MSNLTLYNITNKFAELMDKAQEGELTKQDPQYCDWLYSKNEKTDPVIKKALGIIATEIQKTKEKKSNEVFEELKEQDKTENEIKEEQEYQDPFIGSDVVDE